MASTPLNYKTHIAQLYREHADMLLAYGSGFGCSREDIEDIMHDIFFALYTKPQLSLNASNMRLYLLRALKNRILNHKRLSHSTGTSDLTGLDYTAEVSITDDIAEQEHRAITEQRLNAAIAQLTPRQREAITLRYISGLSYEEIASLLNMSVPSTRNLVFRALQQLRQLMPGSETLCLLACVVLKVHA